MNLAKGDLVLGKIAHHSLRKIYNYEQYGTPFRCGNTWYYDYNEGLKPHAVYYSVEGDQIDSGNNGTLFFDPNELSVDGSLSVQPALLNTKV